MAHEISLIGDKVRTGLSGNLIHGFVSEEAEVKAVLFLSLMPELTPVILIEDNEDEFELLMSAYEQTGCQRPVIWFDKSQEALRFLSETKEAPFMIISDINMPVIDGFELRDLMRDTKAQTLTAIPFFLFTTSVDTRLMQKGYELSVQGFFTKPDNFDALVEIIDFMVRYATHVSERA